MSNRKHLIRLWCAGDAMTNALKLKLCEVDDALIQSGKEIDGWAKSVILNFATPPIKGEVTKGKLRWRGIKLYTTNTYREITYEIKQRGKTLGKCVQQFEFENNDRR